MKKKEKAEEPKSSSVHQTKPQKQAHQGNITRIPATNATQAPQPTDVKGQQVQTPTNGVPPQLTPEQLKAQEEMNATVKEVEKAVFALKFYPVAVTEQSKNEAIGKIVDIYSKGNETVKQLILYMLHEVLTTNAELRMMHSFEYYKMKMPNLDPAQLRMNVYRAMFNYNTSMEGVVETIKLVGKLGGNDAAKLLTYHFTHMCNYENEFGHMVKAAIIEVLGKMDSTYALTALIDYARYTDSERTFHRAVEALTPWKDKLEGMKLPQEEKERLRGKIQELMSREFSESHYG